MLIIRRLGIPRLNERTVFVGEKETYDVLLNVVL